MAILRRQLGCPGALRLRLRLLLVHCLTLRTSVCHVLIAFALVFLLVPLLILLLGHSAPLLLFRNLGGKDIAHSSPLLLLPQHLRLRFWVGIRQTEPGVLRAGRLIQLVFH